MARPLPLVLALAAVFAVGTWAAWDFTVDDAFITFRYSDHLAAGHGPVWNIDGDPVEGFTNFGWMVLFALFAAVDLDLEPVAKVVSLLLGLGVLGMLLTRVRRESGWGAAAVAGGAFVVFLPTYFHIAGGLETMAFGAVALRSVLVALDALADRPVRPWEPPALVLVAGLLRPEGVLVAGLPFAVWLWRAVRSRRGREPLFWTGLAAALGAGYVGWRWVFFGYPLPNTFYVKFGDLAAGADWVEATAVLVGPLSLVTAALLVRRETRASGALLLGTVLATYVPYAVSGPTMDYLHRFAYHAYPVVCLGVGLAVGAIARRSSRRLLAGATGVSVVVWAGLVGVVDDSLPVVANYGPDLHRAQVAIGQGLAEADVPEAHRVVAVSDAGAIPYFSGWEAVDYLGLNNEAIAHGEDPTRVVRDAEPTVIIVTSSGVYVPNSVYGLRVRESVTGYLHVAQIPMREGYQQNVFVLPEWAAPVARGITDSVHEAQAVHDPDRYELTLQRWFDRLAARF